jgi:hypothetical protein
MPISAMECHTPFTGCFSGLAFAVLFTEYVSLSFENDLDDNIGTCKDGGGDSIRDIREQIGLCIAVLRKQAETWPMAALGLENIYKLLNDAHIV